jgi:MoaA/NifB/PqqE/SkfB family radical SAM enzyme|tara:strand:- start:433 stop:1263 length:831 start_codon:yes stop_codon:yes gene_type:complete
MACSQDIPYENLKTYILEHPHETKIDFFGGEPTMYPYFLDILAFARQSGHICTIATNSRRFANSNFTDSVSNLGVTQIRTSIYGDFAYLHDFHTHVNGSFEQTLCGIRNILNTTIDLLVNIVITTVNYHRLPDIVELLYSIGVKKIKFSSLINADDCIELVPNLKTVTRNVERAITKCIEMSINCLVEKSPLCMVPNYINMCIYEPNKYQYKKEDKCDICLVNHFCNGIPNEQIYLYGTGIATPFTHKENINFRYTEEYNIPEQRYFVSYKTELSK